MTPTSQIDEVTGKGVCPLCGGATRYLATDLRPVFPEERLLLEAEPLSLAEKSVWAQDSRYYIAGKARSIPAKVFSGADTDSLSGRLEQLKNQNGSEEITGRFENQVQKFVRANRPRLNALVDEAHRFIREETAKFPEESIVLSFSGGKDSTVTADLVTKALGNPSLVHVFGDTTLCFIKINRFVPSR